MNTSPLFYSAILALIGIVAPLQAQTTALQVPSGLYASTPEEAERVVLVLHEGRIGKQLQSGARMNMYRARGAYANVTWNQKIAKRIAARHGMTYLTDWWMSEIGINCAVYRIPENLTAAAAVDELMADEDVAVAQRMSTFSTMAHVYSDPYFELQASAKHFNLSAMHQQGTGQNIRIAVIDTGIAMDHPDLSGQVSENENFVAAVSPGYAEDTHGTAVAGVIAAISDNNEGIVGVAPGASLIGLKACWPTSAGALEAHCNSFSLALALNKALSLNVDIVNLSLTGPHDPVIERLIDEALFRGIVVVAASMGSDNTKNSFPATMRGVIAVASASDASHEHEVSGLIKAPGDQIITTIPDGKYNFLSGSSLAAAQVSGYIALLREARPYLTVGELRQKLLSHVGQHAGVRWITLRSVPLAGSFDKH